MDDQGCFKRAAPPLRGRTRPSLSPCAMRKERQRLHGARTLVQGGGGREKGTARQHAPLYLIPISKLWFCIFSPLAPYCRQPSHPPGVSDQPHRAQPGARDAGGVGAGARAERHAKRAQPGRAWGP